MNNLQTHYLYPSAIYISRKPFYITTILGSCIAVCLWDKKLKFGGMNHYMLPFWNGLGLASPKYGNIAIEKLIERMLFNGSKKENLIAKVFGGGEIIANQSELFNIGKRNIDIAKTILAEKNIPIIGSSVGGILGRKIWFNTENSEVILKYIKKTKK
jgi:chemotaxis protein CheD